MTTRQRKVYLAGPTVFFRDAEQAFQKLEQACALHGLVPVRPAQPVDDHGTVLQGPQASRHLFLANVARIRSASCVLADLRPFRGDLEPDSGTVFEVGVAYALGKPVAAITSEPLDWGQKVRTACGTGAPGPDGLSMDARYDMLIEDFGGALNLMLAESCALFADCGKALAWLNQHTAHEIPNPLAT